MPEALAPIDTSVPLPPSIKRMAEAADAAHKAAYGVAPADGTPPPAALPADATSAPAPADATPAPAPAPADATPPPAPPAPPAPPVSPPPAPDTVGTAEHEHSRYLAMKGRYEQSQTTIGSLQAQMEEMGNELMRTQQLLSRPANTPPAPPTPLVTEDDVKTYGPELIDVVKRAAREAVQPDIQAVQTQTQQVNQRVTQTAQQGVFSALAEAVPNWQAINNSPEFKRWCALPDIYSGELRGKLLNTAFRNAQASRVIAFFKGFIADGVVTGQVPAPRNDEPATPRVAAVPLETLVAPGRPNPATGDNGPQAADRSIYTRAEIAKFYADVRRGAYAGRDNVKAAEEARIFAAQREGRVR